MARRGQRTDLRRSRQWVAYDEGFHRGDEAALEFGGVVLRTMKRLAAMQDCPLLMARACTAVRTAARAIGVGMTMKGSLPPSSSTVFLIWPPACAATCRPAGSLPVSVTALTRGSSMTRAHQVDADQQRLKDICGEAGAAHDVLDGERALRHVGGVLEQAHVARHERGREEAEDLPEGKIPRHHGEHGADGLIADEARADRP